MANPGVTSIEPYPAIFRRRVLLNAKYWQNYVNEHANEVDALGTERDCIIKAISFALDLAETWPSARELIETFSPYMERRGFWDTWNRILRRALTVARNVEDTARVVNLSVLLARLLFQQSRHGESVAYYRQAICLARQIGDQFNEARACTNLGYYYVEQGQWYRAEVLCCHALNIFERLGSDHGRAHTESHLGVLYHMQSRWDEARQRLGQACAIWQTMGDQHGTMRGFLNLAALYIHTEKFNKALKYLQKALSQAQLTGEEMAIGIIYMNMGLTHRLREDLTKAETYTKQAERIFRRYSSLAQLARVWDNLGIVYSHQRRWVEAISYLEKSLDAWRSLDNKLGEAEVLLDFTESALLREDWQRAKARLKQAEQFIRANYKNKQHLHLQARLKEYRCSLSSKKLNKPQRVD